MEEFLRQFNELCRQHGYMLEATTYHDAPEAYSMLTCREYRPSETLSIVLKKERT